MEWQVTDVRKDPDSIVVTVVAPLGDAGGGTSIAVRIPVECLEKIEAVMCGVGSTLVEQASD